MTTTTTTATSTTATSTGTRRRAARLAGVVLAASTLLGGFATAAGAETPPAPPQQLDIAVPPAPPAPDLPLANPVGTNTNTAGSYAVTSRGDSWMDITFTSTAPKLVVQFSATKPTWVAGKMTMGAVSPQALSGVPISGGTGDLAAKKTYRYSFSRDGLTPGTQYYVLVTMGGAPGQDPTYSTFTGSTMRRYVRMTPVTIDMIDDGDAGIRGAGELRFGFRVAPEGNTYGASMWGSWTAGWTKLHSDDSWNLWGTGHGHWREMKGGTAVVQIQGVEDDSGVFNPCAIQGGESKPEQFSDGCHDWAYAETTVALPTGRDKGAGTQYVWAEVSRSPALRFRVLVKVDTWMD